MVVVWLVVPVVLNVFGIAAYVWSFALHLHVAGSLLVRLSVVLVVPVVSAWLFVGLVNDAVGGVVSASVPTLNVILTLVCMRLLLASVQST
jgi:hypothetical protein